MGKNCSALKKHEQILKYIKLCAKIDRHQRRFLNLVGELLEGILPSLHSGTSTSRRASLLPLQSQPSFNYTSTTGGDNGVRAGNEQNSLNIKNRE